MVAPPPSSPDGAALGRGAAPGEAEAARRVLAPPDALAAPPRPLVARRRLDRLRRALRREGWRTERKYGDVLIRLRVYAPGTLCIGESVTVVSVGGVWWYRSSTGVLLAPCSRVDLAVERVSALLMPWVSAEDSSGRTGRG